VVKYATDITHRAEELRALKTLVDGNFDKIGDALERSAAQARIATGRSPQRRAAFKRWLQVPRNWLP